MVIWLHQTNSEKKKRLEKTTQRCKVRKNARVRRLATFVASFSAASVLQAIHARGHTR